MKKYLKLNVILMLLATFAACKSGNKEQSAKKVTPPVAVDVLIASIEDFPSSIEVNGTVLSDEMVELHPEVSGRLTFLKIPDGANVKAGTVLAKINDADLQAQLHNKKCNLNLLRRPNNAYGSCLQ